MTGTNGCLYDILRCIVVVCAISKYGREANDFTDVWDILPERLYQNETQYLPLATKVCESLFYTKKGEKSRDVWKKENTTGGGGGHCPPPDKGAVLGGASGRSRRGLVTCPWGTDSHKVFVSQAFQSVLCITECAAADYLVL